MTKNDVQTWMNVAPVSRGFCVIGKGKSLHITRGNDESLCGRLMIADGSRYIDGYDVLDFNPCRSCYKIMERESAELEKVGTVAAAPKLKMSEVRGDVNIVTAGNGETFHARTDGDEALCNVRHKDPLRSWGQAHEQKPNLELCAKCSKLAPTGPVTMVEQTFEIPGLDRTVTKTVAVPTENTTNGETQIMAAKNDVTTDEGAKVVEQIDANIERVRSLAEADNAEGAKELNDETETLISSLTGKGSIAVKKEKRDALSAAGKVEPTKAVAVKAEAPSLATADYTKIPGLVKLVDEAAEIFKAGVAAEKEKGGAAKRLAAIDLDMRLNILNADGVPDLHAKSDQAKRASGDLARKALEGVENTYENDQLFKKMQRSKQNAMSDTLVQYVRALDNSPEEYEKYFGKVKEAHPDLSPTEAVIKFYDLPRKSQNELKREKYEATKALEAAAKDAGKSVKELVAERAAEAAKAAEGGDGEGTGEAAAKATPGAKIVESVTKANDAIGTAVEAKSVKKLTNDEKRALKAKLEAISLRAAAAAAALVIEDDSADEDDDEDGDDEAAA